MKKLDNVERINGKWVGYDSFGNSWRINNRGCTARKGYWEAFANISQEDKLKKIHYVTGSTLYMVAEWIRELGGKDKK